MNSFPDLPSNTIPVSSPTIIVAPTGNTPVLVESKKHIQPKLSVLLMLLFVFAFVSLAIGTIIWILDFEYTKAHDKKTGYWEIGNFNTEIMNYD